MNTIKGFATLRDHINNDHKVTAPIGELSVFSRTFSKDQRIFSDPNLPKVGLTVYTAKDDEGNKFEVLEAHSDHMLEMIAWVDEISTSGEVTLDHGSFLTAVQSHKPEMLASLEYDEIIEYNGAFVPGHVTWNYYGITYSIWFADEVFKVQYDDFEHSIVAPVEVINDLQRPYSEIHEIIEFDVSMLILKANEITRDQPYTALKPVKVTWVDRVTGNETILTWMVAVYGPFGDNPVSIGNALKQYILDNSDFNEIEWHDVMPKLFKPTEFVIVPAWNKVSVPDGQVQDSIYSPQLRFKEMLYLMSRFTTSYYEKEHLMEHMVHATHIYKSLSFMAVGNDGNNDGIYSLDLKFPDYNLVSSSEIDFNRLSPITQEWVKLIHRMFIVSESMVETTILESDFSRLKRGGIIYLVASYEGVNYLVVTKESFKDLYAYDGSLPNMELPPEDDEGPVDGGLDEF